MRKRTRVIVIWSVIGLAAVAGIFFFSSQSGEPGELDAFARCLTDTGAIFYGAFWCPHCQTQKAAFGKSRKLLPYVECSTPNGKGQLPVCRDKNIQGYPTWEFRDGARISGEVSLKQLSEKTGCVLPP